MTHVALYSGMLSPRLIATSDDPDLVAEVARRMLGNPATSDPDPAVTRLERGRREALEDISNRSPRRLRVVADS